METAARRATNPSVQFASPARLVKAEHIVDEIAAQIGDLSIVAIYRDKIRTQRTRQYELKSPRRASHIEILHTLLGIELKIGNRRLLCPDLATARYLSVFARLGCEVVAVPYDITQISWIADELESSWHRMMLLVEHFTAGRTTRLCSIVRRRILDQTRQGVDAAGAGSKFPQFNPIKRRQN